MKILILQLKEGNMAVNNLLNKKFFELIEFANIYEAVDFFLFRQRWLARIIILLDGITIFINKVVILEMIKCCRVSIDNNKLLLLLLFLTKVAVIDFPTICFAQ